MLSVCLSVLSFVRCLKKKPGYTGSDRGSKEVYCHIGFHIVWGYIDQSTIRVKEDV